MGSLVGVIGELIGRAACWHGDRTAVVDDVRTRSFREIDRRSNQLANVLIELSAEAGTRVGIILPNRVEFVECDFAIAKAGKVKVPIDPRLLLSERMHIARDAGIDILVLDTESAAELEPHRDELPDLRHVVTIDGNGSHGYEDLIAKASTRVPGIAVRPDAVSVILYTSGTTGRPKGAAATFRSRLSATRSMIGDELDIGPDDRMVHMAPTSHGSGSKILAYFVRGAVNVLAPRFDPERFLKMVDAGEATASFFVPTMLAMLLEVEGRERFRTDGLNAVTYGGSSIAPDLLAEVVGAFGPSFVQVYGSCEAPHPVLVLPKSEHSADAGDSRLRSAGREVVGVSVRLVDGDGVEVPDGDVGEVVVAGDNVMVGYWNNEAATGAVFRDGYYLTGDLGMRDEDGRVHITGRKRDMIISGGYNVYPAQVEAALSAHPNVLEVAVVGVKDRRWGETVKAFVVPRPGTQLGAEELDRFSRIQLASYSVPRLWEVADSLPKGSTGKILKRVLVEQYGDQAAAVEYHQS